MGKVGHEFATAQGEKYASGKTGSRKLRASPARTSPSTELYRFR